MRIAIIGAGAMGCLFGGRLAQARHDVVLVDVHRPQIEALNARGLVLADDEGISRIAIRAGSADEFVGRCDLIMFFTKAVHTASAAESAKHLFGPESWALTVQNGIGNDDAIAAHLGYERLVIGMTNYPADLVRPGEVMTHGFGEVRIWAARHPSPRVSEIAACLNDAGLICRADPDVRTAIWEKVTFNSAINGLCAVTRLPVGGLGEHPDLRSLVERIVEEGSAVAQAVGHGFDPTHLWRTIEGAFASHKEHKPSMLQDILASRPTEVDAINGAIVREGRARGIPTPYNDALACLVRGIERSASRANSGQVDGFVQSERTPA